MLSLDIIPIWHNVDVSTEHPSTDVYNCKTTVWRVKQNIDQILSFKCVYVNVIILIKSIGRIANAESHFDMNILSETEWVFSLF